MTEEQDGDTERTDWVIPVGTGKVSYEHFNVDELEEMAKQGIHIEPDTSHPKESKVTQIVVEGMPAPKKKK